MEEPHAHAQHRIQITCGGKQGHALTDAQRMRERLGAQGGDADGAQPADDVFFQRFCLIHLIISSSKKGRAFRRVCLISP